MKLIDYKLNIKKNENKEKVYKDENKDENKEKEYKEEKKTKKQCLVDEIFKPDKNGISKWISREELSETNLKLSDNGNSRHGIFFGDNRYIWEKQILRKNTVISLRTNGLNNDILNGHKRPIRKDIKKYHFQFGCVSCGSKSSLVIDHKNDLYNDIRVLNTKTQNIDDFQCLCQHCNLQKRQIIKETKETGKRYKATNIKQLEIFGIDFIVGDETFDPTDINAMVGTYWYDPVAFMAHIKKRMTN